MTNLMGEFRHKIDAKGRLSLPSKLRSQLSDSLVVTVNPKSECLYAFISQEAFENWMVSIFEKEGGYDAGKSRHVNIRRVLNSRASDIEIDGANRINLGSSRCETAGIDKDVVLVGNGDYFEIWDAKRWDEFCAEVDIDIASFFD